MQKTWYSLLALALLPFTSWAIDLQPDIALKTDRQHVVINIPQLRLFVYENGQFISSHHIAVGKNKTKTPLGEYEIGAKAFNPTWYVPQSIQKEMAAQGKPVVKTIAPGPNNPLGPVFVRFGDPKLGLGIHGTSAPSSVPGIRSHGCVRMKSPEALQFAKNINRGSQVSVIYQMAVLNEDEQNRLWLAVYGDPYFQKNLDTDKLKTAIKNWEEKHQQTIYSSRLDTALKNKNGKITCLNCKSADLKLANSAQLRPVSWLQEQPEHEESVETNEETEEAAENNISLESSSEAQSVGIDVEPISQNILF